MNGTSRPIRLNRLAQGTVICLAAAAFAVSAAAGPETQKSQRVVKPNYAQARLYSSSYLRQFVYDSSVRPNWIGKTDEFWYSYRTSAGTKYWRVDPERQTKEELFDHVELAAKLSVAVRKPLDAAKLPITRVELDDKGASIKFVVDKDQYEYELSTEKLAKLGKAPPRRSRNRYSRGGRRRDTERTGDRDGSDGRHRNFSPDRTAYVFVKGHDLYYVEIPEGYKYEKESEKKKGGKDADGHDADSGGDKADKKKLQKDREEQKGDSKEGDKGDEGKGKELPTPAIGPDLDGTAVRLTKDGEEKFSFAPPSRGSSRGRGGQSSGQKKGDKDKEPKERKTRPRVSWSEDSKAFYVTRRDSRNVKELWVINSLSDPRPTLQSYSYSMPGEDGVRVSQLNYFTRDDKKFHTVKPKWKQENYRNIHWAKGGHRLRFVRGDRLVRNAELCSLDTAGGELKCLIAEGFEAANVSVQSARHLEETGEMIWWSERTGWGHFYLYDREGNLKNAITSGEFRASRIIDVDEKNRLLYFRGNAREGGENIYYPHLYCVRLDGSRLTLMDPGDAYHRSTLSPSKKYVVDNCSRVNMGPVSVLRDGHGKEVMRLEESDLSRLKEVGWKVPEVFTVKAADGVTELYGNMWKPFDFDPNKKYPIIAHVYPGPQTEGVSHTFSATAGDQQLAQMGFIVIQVGHRGGTPQRSKSYHTHGYYNLRDYGLADKKVAIEQLAQRFPFIDIERVGIYGHSGGGFMTAAALLKVPYNEFFKVGVATAGNHDNNIYNNYWAERYHGLKEVAASESRSKTSGARRGGSSTRRGSPSESENHKGFRVEGSDFFYEHEGRVNEHGEFVPPPRPDADKEETDKKEVKDKGSADKKRTGDSKKTRFEIKVPTNAELAENLKGHLFLIHGESDNNVHPANTLRLVDALIKADKRFDMLYLPATRHSFGRYKPYVTQRMYEYFAEHLLDDYQSSADLSDRK